jgi:hypothetical protein
VAFVVFLSFAITMMRRFQRLDLQQRQGRPATFIFISFFIFGIGATLLQLYNVAALGAFWPFNWDCFSSNCRGVPVCAHDSPAARIKWQRLERGRNLLCRLGLVKPAVIHGELASA